MEFDHAPAPFGSYVPLRTVRCQIPTVLESGSMCILDFAQRRNELAKYVIVARKVGVANLNSDGLVVWMQIYDRECDVICVADVNASNLRQRDLELAKGRAAAAKEKEAMRGDFKDFCEPQSVIASARGESADSDSGSDFGGGDMAGSDNEYFRSLEATYAAETEATSEMIAKGLPRTHCNR